MAVAGSGGSMALNTFGAVLRYAIEMEERAAQFYSGAAAAAKDSQVTGFLRDLAVVRARRAQQVTRIRRENVAEMILEPVANMDGRSYARNLDLSGDASDSERLRMASLLEEDAQRFYLDAGQRLSIAEVSRALSRLAKENGQAKSKADALRPGSLDQPDPG